MAEQESIKEVVMKERSNEERFLQIDRKLEKQSKLNDNTLNRGIFIIDISKPIVYGHFAKILCDKMRVSPKNLDLKFSRRLVVGGEGQTSRTSTFGVLIFSDSAGLKFRRLDDLRALRVEKSLFTTERFKADTVVSENVQYQQHNIYIFLLFITYYRNKSNRLDTTAVNSFFFF